jgi:hypothetical protein
MKITHLRGKWLPLARIFLRTLPVLVASVLMQSCGDVRTPRDDNLAVGHFLLLATDLEGSWAEVVPGESGANDSNPLDACLGENAQASIEDSATSPVFQRQRDHLSLSSVAFVLATEALATSMVDAFAARESDPCWEQAWASTGPSGFRVNVTRLPTFQETNGSVEMVTLRWAADAGGGVKAFSNVVLLRSGTLMTVIVTASPFFEIGLPELRILTQPLIERMNSRER